MKRIAAAGLVVVGCFTNQALAQQPYRGWFAGISAGQSSADIDSSSSLRILGAPASTVSSDDTDTGFKLYGGYRFNRHLAVEIGYADLGSFTATRSINPPGAPGSARGTFDVSGIYGQAVGIVPIGDRFSIFGTAGLYTNTVKASAAATGSVALLGTSGASNSDTNLKLGVGAGFDFTDKLGVRVEYERFFDLGDDSVAVHMDVDLVTVGVVFRF